MGRIEKMKKYASERGIPWTALYALRSLGMRIIGRLDRTLVRIEKQNFLTGHDTVSSLYHTVDENRRWNDSDWSSLGEEWTLDVKKYRGIDPDTWKNSLIDEMMRKYVKRGTVALEIGPGGGRWTEELQTICTRLIIADINEKCLSVCKERFRHADNIEYYRVDTEGKEFIPEAVVPSGSIDAVWSYDVFVHINATDIEKYLIDFKRVLKPGGHAVLHHAGSYPENKRPGTRSFIDARFFLHLLEKHGLTPVEQNTSLPHMPGDVITVFARR